MPFVADIVNDTIEHLKQELHAAITQHVGFVRSLEKHDFFPELVTDRNYTDTLSELAITVETVTEQLKKYSVFDGGLEEFSDGILDLVGIVGDRFVKWNLRKKVTVKEAAAMHSRSTSTIYRWIKKGLLDATKVNGRWVVDPTKRDPKNDLLLQIAA